MNTQFERDQIWDQLGQPWDIVVIGGGITGAGVLHAAASLGLRALLLEARDFAFGTSSRSSKLVHGGFRYLRNRQFGVTRESVREREWLLKNAPYLVEKLSFLLPEWRSSRTPAWQFTIGVVLYDLLAPKWDHRRLSAPEMLDLAPALRADGLTGGWQYYDASVDDSCLVLRVLRAARREGAAALNYTRVDGLLRGQDGRVRGVQVLDLAQDQPRAAEVKARVVVNAAGPWSDEIRARVGVQPRLRKCRGSHLIFPSEKFPLKSAVTLMHPRDNRAMFAIPWEGATILGTTDIDHPREWEQVEPFTTPEESAYILEALAHTFPQAEVGQADVLSSFSGLRPLVCPQGPAHPSAVSRRHVVWDEHGLITITGGKLTTFRIMALAALQAALKYLPETPRRRPNKPLFAPGELPDSLPQLPPEHLRYLAGRYGADTPRLLASADPAELTPVASLRGLWAELRWAARACSVVHLDDLLLRRVRLGLLLPRGGADHLARIRQIVQPELGWDDQRWQAEERAYLRTWRRYYAPAPVGLEPLPDKLDIVEETKGERHA